MNRPRRVGLTALAALCVAVLFACGKGQAFRRPDLDPHAQDVLTWANQARADLRLPPLTLSGELTALAQGISDNVAVLGDSPEVFEQYELWFDDMGYFWRPLAANFLQAQPHESFAHIIPTHLNEFARESLLHPNATHIGLGYIRARQLWGDWHYLSIIVATEPVFLSATSPPAALRSVGEYPHDLYAWMVGCSAVLAVRNNENPYTFGMTAKPETAEYLLSVYWGIHDKERLASTVRRMTASGHNASFAEAYALVSSLSADELSLLIELSDGADVYMWPYTQRLGEKWGERQIKAWDWFRMFHLVGWGYNAGLVTMDEAYELLEPVIELLLENFDNWNEATDNYMDGYAWWSRIDVTDKDNPDYNWRKEIQRVQRGNHDLLDPAVWEKSP
jgi:hypothetical protein